MFQVKKVPQTHSRTHKSYGGKDGEQRFIIHFATHTPPAKRHEGENIFILADLPPLTRCNGSKGLLQVARWVERGDNLTSINAHMSSEVDEGLHKANDQTAHQPSPRVHVHTYAARTGRVNFAFS